MLDHAMHSATTSRQDPDLEDLVPKISAAPMSKQPAPAIWGADSSDHVVDVVLDLSWHLTAPPWTTSRWSFAASAFQPGLSLSMAANFG